ncbi:type II toxin-antitoxin system VapC family toxin [bacterium]|nr:type II toxin-antitoxin system VapC family toxin [bacterium]
MRFLLDTNILSEPRRRLPEAEILAQLQRYQAESAIAATTWHELKYGCDRLPASKRKQQLTNYIKSLHATMPILPYDEAAATWHAAERSRLSLLGRTPAFADGQIAAIAATQGLILVTRNERDYQPFANLQLANWFAP